MNCTLYRIIIDDSLIKITISEIDDDIRMITFKNLKWDLRLEIINIIRLNKSNCIYTISDCDTTISNIDRNCIKLIWNLLLKNFSDQIESLAVEFLSQTKNKDEYLNNNEALVEVVLTSAAFHDFYCDKWRELALRFEFKKDRILNFLKQI